MQLTPGQMVGGWQESTVQVEPKSSFSSGMDLRQAETAHLHVFVQTFSKPQNQSELLIPVHEPQCSNQYSWLD